MLINLFRKYVLKLKTLSIILFIISLFATAETTFSDILTDDIPNDNDFTTSKPIMSMPETPGVNMVNGFLTYNYPISVPPGRAGIEPNPMLYYNSSKNNGPVGVGWDISVDSISRLTRKGLSYSDNDYVVNDSGELVNRFSSWGDSFYGEKIEGDFTKYYKDPSYTKGWIAYKTNGTRYWYGTTENSREFDPIIPTKIFKWYLVRIEDSNGNYLTIDYEKNAGKVYVKTIKYTGNTNTGLLPTHKVEYVYKNRTDISYSYQSQFKTSTNRLLDRIDIYSNSNNTPEKLIKKYLLFYDPGTNTERSKLRKIQPVSPDNSKSLPPVEFTWKDGGDINFSKLVYEYNNDFIRTSNYVSTDYVVDVNGDGLSDILTLQSAAGSIPKKFETVIKSNKGEFSTNSISWYVPMDYLSKNLVIPSLYVKYVNKWQPPLLADVNGDGKVDIVFKCQIFEPSEQYENDPTMNQGNIGQNTYFTYLSNGNGTFSFRDKVIFPASENILYFADVNNDGLDDAVCIKLHYFHLLKNVLYGREIGIKLRSKNGTLGSYKHIYSLPKFIDDSFMSYFNPIFSDINGDGVTDIVLKVTKYDYDTNNNILRNVDTEYVFCISRGNGSFEVLQKTFFVDEKDWRYGMKSFVDIDGDSIADGLTYVLKMAQSGQYALFLYHRKGFGDGTFGSSIEKKIGFNIETTYLLNNSFGHNPLPPCHYFDDINRDGIPDIIFKLHYELMPDRFKFVSFINQKKISNLLTTIKSGPEVDGVVKGVSSTVTYKPSSFYENKHLPFVIQTVSSITVEDDLFPTTDARHQKLKTSYTYSGGLYNSTTREFYGFESVNEKRPDNSTISSIYHQEEFTIGKKKNEKVIDFSGALSQEKYFFWNPVTISDAYPCKFLKLDYGESFIFNNNLAIYSRNDFSYNIDNGKLTKSVTTGTNLKDSITFEYEYVNAGVWNWCLSKQWTTGILDSVGNKGIVRQETYSDFDNKGNYRKKTIYNNQGDDPVLQYQYDSYGNKERVWDAKNNLTQVEFDTIAKTHPSKITLPPTANSTHVVTFPVYDYATGQAIESRDENNNPVYNFYDDFGRLYRTDYPDGGKTEIEYHDDVYPIYTITKKKVNDGSPTIDSYEYYDGMGRPIMNVSQGENGWYAVATAYDDIKRTTVVTGPFKTSTNLYGSIIIPSASVPVKTEVKDIHGNIVFSETLDTAYGSVSTMWEYKGPSVTITDPDLYRKTETKDCLGRIISVSEYLDVSNNNSVEYQTFYNYNAANELVSVIDSKQNKTTIKYDTLGRKIETNDPDMGSWRYNYDANGNMVEQIDAKGQIVNMIYDPLNRIHRKIYAGTNNQIVYSYDHPSTVNGKGKLSSVLSSDVVDTYNSYDTMGRVVQRTKTISGKTWSYSSVYDKTGKIISMIYPKESPSDPDFILNYDYFTGTSLISRVYKQGGNVFANFSEYQPNGNIGRINFQNGVTSSYGYDSLSLRMKTNITRNNTSNTLMDFDYVYSPAGDIETVSDNFKSTDYRYEYDSLHRMVKEYTEGNAAPSYNEIGDSLRYYYPPDSQNTSGYKPHAVTGVNVVGNNGNVFSSYEYDKNGNMIISPDLMNPLRKRIIRYNFENKPTHIYLNNADEGGLLASFIYDGEGVRVKKKAGAVETFYVNNNYEVIASKPVKYIFAGNLRIAKIDENGVAFFHKDHLGSSMLLTRTGSEQKDLTLYRPYGLERTLPDQSDEKRYKFTDQELDGETGLYNYDARLYDPGLGMFVSADSVVPDWTDPQGLNRYAYCRNNPLIYTDPSGHVFKAITTAVKIAKVVYKGGDLYMTVSGMVDDIKTIGSLDPKVGTGERLVATGSLLLDIAGVKDGYQLGKNVLKIADDVNDNTKVINRAENIVGTSMNTKPRFIADDAGNIVDTHATPLGRYIQPDKSATDILQDASHPGLDDFTSRTHTHKATVHVNPKDPTKGTTKLSKHPDPVTADEVKNIMDGTATRSESRGH